ncbi:MAG: branched-chain amino acid transport system II carrier protein [Intestinibacter sp.]
MGQIKKNQGLDSIVVGFAAFAIFFGAGNLIFPPYLGLRTGSSWMIAFIGFVIGDVLLALAGLVSGSDYQGDEPIPILERIGKVPAIIVGTVMMICLGPLLVIPRTGATTFEISIQPLFPGINAAVFSIIFFGITFVFTIGQSKVVDVVGKIFTPILLICLVVLIITGIVNPIGDVTQNPIISQGLFSEGLMQGYQTLDSIGASSTGVMIMASIVAKGYSDKKEKSSMIFKASIVAGTLLILVYGGLCFLGSRASTLYDGNTIGQTELLINIVGLILGSSGKVLLAIIVFFACLTTSVGLTSIVADFFCTVSKGKIPYKVAVTALIVFAAVMSTLGTSAIIQFSVPILTVLYPLVVTLIVLTLFKKRIKRDLVFKVGASVATIVSLLDMLGVGVVKTLPFTSLGLNWILPVVVSCLIVNFLPMREEEEIEEELIKAQ